MENLIFATSNKAKFEEAKSILKKRGIELEWANIEIPEIQTLCHESLVMEKAESAYKQLNRPVVVDDTAIFLHVFENFPGIMAKFVINSIGFNGINNLLNGKKRDASFKTLLCFFDGKKKVLAEGKTEGLIAKNQSKKVNPSVKWSSIFVPIGSKRPLSELSEDDFNLFSHRAKAFTSLASLIGEEKI